MIIHDKQYYFFGYKLVIYIIKQKIFSICVYSFKITGRTNIKLGMNDHHLENYKGFVAVIKPITIDFNTTLNIHKKIEPSLLTNIPLAPLKLLGLQI